MLILHAEGQTGNIFFTYLRYIGDCLETGEKIIVLSPDLSLEHYPNLIKSRLIYFPFYFKTFSNIIGSKNNIKALYYLFGNKYITKLLKYFFIIIPNVQYIIAPTGSNQSKNHFKYTDKIRKIFTPNQQTTKSVEAIFNEKRITHQIICGIHLRFGDYKTFQGGRYYFSQEQYHSKMLEVKEIFHDQRVAFFISSNEKINMSVFNGCDCFSIPNSNAVKDLYALSISDYIVGPPSTFSGWASYYGDTLLYFIEDIEKRININSFFQIFDVWS